MDPQVSVAPQGGYVSADVILRYWKNRWKPICYSKKTLTVMVIMILIIGGCERAATPITALLPSETPTLAITSTSETPPTPTNTVSNNVSLTEQCPTILPSEDLSKTGIKGVMVLLREFNPYSYAEERAFLLDIKTQERVEFSSDDSGMLSLSGMAVSPDHKTLAYALEDFNNESVGFVLSNNMGEREKTIMFQEGSIDETLSVFSFGNFQRWLNNELISLGEGNIVFNPYTEDVKIYDPKDFPDISPDDHGIYVIRFDPQVSRVVYSISHARTAVVDLVNYQVLAEIPALYKFVEVSWSPDGEFVAIEGESKFENLVSEELFIVDRDGKSVIQATYLAQYYGKEHLLFSPVWSPDGSRIAFWQAYDDENISGKTWRLFVFDLESSELTSYCTWGTNSNFQHVDPVWSPDGKQLLLADFSIQDDIRTFMIDLDKNVAIPVGEDIENVIPVGWMVAP